MTDKKILVLDIDGTLVNSEKKITPETLKYLKMIQEQGHIVALASGRPFPGLKQYSDALGLAEYGGYALSFNGGKVISCATQEVIYTKAIPNRYAKILYEFAKERHIGMVTYKDNQVITGTDTDGYMEFEARLNHMELCQVDDFLKVVDFDIDEAEPGEITVTFKNISKEPLNISGDELKERFVRGDRSRNTKGNGLGLSIAQSLMELQNGKVEIMIDGDLFKVVLLLKTGNCKN